MITLLLLIFSFCITVITYVCLLTAVAFVIYCLISFLSWLIDLIFWG
jgi:hypothetical protein